MNQVRLFRAGVKFVANAARWHAYVSAAALEALLLGVVARQLSPYLNCRRSVPSAAEWLAGQVHPTLRLEFWHDTTWPFMTVCVTPSRRGGG